MSLSASAPNIAATSRTGASRWRARARAGRLELTPVGADAESRSKKIVAHIGRLQDELVDVFIRLRAQPGVPEELVIDFDATDDPVHGDPWGQFFHGDYKSDCFLPLYAFCGDWPLAAILRPSNIDAAAGTVTQLARIIPKLRAAWPDVRIVIRGDSASTAGLLRRVVDLLTSSDCLQGVENNPPVAVCREPIMRWCEQHHVDFLFGLAKNKRLIRALGKQRHEAKQQFEQTGQAARVFKDFRDRTKKNWFHERRVVGKAEHLAKGANPRFVVTSLSGERAAAAALCVEPVGERAERRSLLPAGREATEHG